MKKIIFALTKLFYNWIKVFWYLKNIFLSAKEFYLKHWQKGRKSVVCMLCLFHPQPPFFLNLFFLERIHLY